MRGGYLQQDKDDWKIEFNDSSFIENTGKHNIIMLKAKFKYTKVL